MDAAPTPTLILNVDDNPGGLYAKSRVLRRAGFDVCEASTGADALRLMTERAPALVLLDVKLPDISGLEVCRRIKQSPATRHVPVLHISATYTSDDFQAISAESGADIYLVEPIGHEELITAVRTLLRLRTTEIGLAESEARLRLAMEAAEIATWELDLRNGVGVWSPQMYALLGLRAGERGATWQAWRERVHADDLARVSEAMERVRRERAPLQCEYRVASGGRGEERWLSTVGNVFLDTRGDPTRLLGITTDITARKLVEVRREELLMREHAARTQAEEAARVKDQFLATLSHELRTPLSAVIGWLHLLRTGRLDAAEQQRALDTIERNARLQTALINDMLDVSRIVTGQLRLELAPTQLAAVVAAAIESVRPSARSKNLTIVDELPDQALVIRADAGRLQQVFTNLLTNAIKFSPEHREIRVTTQSTADSLRIAVADRGEGIASDVLPYVFERFWQADGSPTRKHGGLGLGLAIVRHLLELHGASIEAASDGPGRGSTFTVVLPRTLEVRSGARAPERAATSQRSDRSLRGMHVLVVDDDSESAAMLAELLGSEGAVVQTANSVAQAIAMFAAGSVDVLISDIGMPERDGYDLIRALRSEFPHRMRRCVAIALSGYARTEDRQAAMEASFDLHMSKPFDIERLSASIVALADARKLQASDQARPASRSDDNTASSASRSTGLTR